MLRPFALRSILLCACILPAIASIAHADCPESSVSVSGRAGSGTVIFDESVTSDDAEAMVSRGKSLASYDLASGTMTATMWVDETFLHTSRATTVDRFTLYGAAAAIVTIKLHVHMNATTDPARRVAGTDVTIRIAARDQEDSVTSQNISLGGTILIQTYMLAGDPLEITCEAIAEGWGYEPSATVTCQLEFADIPDGAVITSCNGFTTNALPVRESTWGGVKALYR
jgi:hypothetical protein